MEFSYRGRDDGGRLHEGRIEASSREAAAANILRNGITPVHLEEFAEPVDILAKLQSWQEAHAKVALDDLIVFCRQMYALSRAGIPIVRSIRGLSESSGSPALKRVLVDIADGLESGVNLASCLQEHPRIFNDLFVSIVHVGENTGGLDQAFKRLAENLDLERQARKRVQQAVRYPLMVISALSIALMIVNIWVIPAFASVFDRLGAALPLPTRILIATSGFFVHFWWLVLLIVGAAIFAFYSWIATEEGRLEWDRRKLRIPLVGSLLELVALSRFARNFAMMLAAGLPINQALVLVAGAIGNAFLGRAVTAMRAGIERGDSMVNVAARSGIFSPLVMQMLAVGEETGRVEELLDDVADFYDQEVEYSLSRLSESIEPLLILAMGGMVLVLALGVFLPIWSLGQAAIHH
ncbi:MAG: type II secretion system F family protein [Pseudomonadales bacterium]|nr:type II secretion system F family protein [Pseudomonadales bacterium]